MISILGKQYILQHKININVRRKKRLMPQDIRNIHYALNCVVGNLTVYELPSEGRRSTFSHVDASR